MLSSFFFVSLGTSKKYHEHIRRTALGKITDDTKKEKRDNLRKERVCDSESNYNTSRVYRLNGITEPDLEFMNKRVYRRSPLFLDQ